MYDHAEEKCMDKHEMFILGLLHDIGYMFCHIENDKEKLLHNKIGGQFLEKQGYKYWREVYFHGDYPCQYKSAALDLLNEADMQINQQGEIIGYQKRLEDIANQYGKDSVQYQNSKNIIHYLQKKNKRINI